MRTGSRLVIGFRVERGGHRRGPQVRALAGAVGGPTVTVARAHVALRACALEAHLTGEHQQIEAVDHPHLVGDALTPLAAAVQVGALQREAHEARPAGDVPGGRNFH